MRCMTLCIHLWDVLYAIATDPGTIAMVQGSRFSMKIRGVTATLYGFDSLFLGYAACRRWCCPPSRSTSVEFCGAQNMLLLLVHPVQFILNFFYASPQSCRAKLRPISDASPHVRVKHHISSKTNFWCISSFLWWKEALQVHKSLLIIFIHIIFI
jgi:hypothetical protein